MGKSVPARGNRYVKYGSSLRQKYRQGGPGNHWVWLGAVSATGYGYVRSPLHKGKVMPAHRVVYEVEVGPIADGHDLHHTCGVRTCVNPDHLEQVESEQHQAAHGFGGELNGAPIPGLDDEGGLAGARQAQRRDFPKDPPF